MWFYVNTLAFISFRFRENVELIVKHSLPYVQIEFLKIIYCTVTTSRGKRLERMQDFQKGVRK